MLRYHIVGTLGLAIIGCNGGHLNGPRRPHEPVGPAAEGLRTAFNADSGHVRAIYLASPT
jgi:hypothetical protein